MKISFLKSLIQVVESSDIEELEFSRWWTKVRITKSRSAAAGRNPDGAIQIRVGEPAPEPRPRAEQAAVEEKPSKLVEINSPMVGTFYRAPSPGAKPFVEAGDRVQPGQVVCIIEAMKLMNEIKSEVVGTVAKILVENGKPVEYGQPLFLVAPL